MTVQELRDELDKLVESGFGHDEVRLRIRHGDRITLRSGLDGMSQEMRYNGGVEVLSSTTLLWGANA